MLLVPALLGALCARLGVVGEPRRAVTAFNGFVLYIAFPALVVHGLLDPGFAMPSEPGFWLTIPLAYGALALLCPLLARLTGRREQAGTLALVGLFGNVAYIGLPLAVAFEGPGVIGIVSVMVAIFVAISVGVGPLLLVAWSGAGRASPAAVLKQPLFWAPWVGLLLRALPGAAPGVARDVLTPIAQAAAPTALVMIGIYLFAERGVLRRAPAGTTLHVGVRLLLAPALMAAVAFALDPAHAPLFVLLAGMPAAITTFSLAYEAEVGADRVAATIVWSTLLALVALPLLATLVGLGSEAR